MASYKKEEFTFVFISSRSRNERVNWQFSISTMNAFATICVLLAALCAVQASNPWNEMQSQITKTKNNVNAVSSDLNNYVKTLKFNTDNKLSNQKLQGMQQINNIVNPAIQKIREQVDAAKAEGKDAEQCYENARLSLRSYSMTGFDDLETCKKIAQQSLQKNWDSLDSTQATLNGYIIELNNVMLQCQSSNTIQMQTCVAITCGSVNQSLNVLKSSISSMKLNTDKAANNAQLSQFSCNNNVVSVVRSGTSQVSITASQCVNN